MENPRDSNGSPWLSAWHMSKRELQLKDCLHQIGLQHVCGAFSWLLTDAKGPSPLAGSIVPRQEDMGCIGKTASWACTLKQASKPHSYGISASLSCPDVPQWWTVACRMKQPLSFPSYLWTHTEQKQTKNGWHIIIGPYTNDLLFRDAYGFPPPVITPVGITELKLGKVKKKCDLDHIFTRCSSCHFRLLLPYISSLLGFSRIPWTLTAKPFVELWLESYSTIHGSQLF